MSKLRINELESLETGRSLKVDEIDSDVRLDLANPDKGAAMVGIHGEGTLQNWINRSHGLAASQLGLVPGVDYTTLFNTTLKDKVLSDGITEIVLDTGDITVTGTLDYAFNQVVFSGEGELLSLSWDNLLQRIPTIRAKEKQYAGLLSAGAFSNDAAYRAIHDNKEIRVVLFGDSISAGSDYDTNSIPAGAQMNSGVDNEEVNNSFAKALFNEMCSILPKGVRIRFYNRSIAGYSYSSCDQAWDSIKPHVFSGREEADAGKSWRDCVIDLNPDLVIHSMGMNHGPENYFSAYKSKWIDYVESKRLTGSFDQVILTTPTPNFESADQYGDFRDYSLNASKFYVAAQQRYAASLYPHHSLVDIAAYSSIKRFGFDPRSCVMDKDAEDILLNGAPTAQLTAASGEVSARHSKNPIYHTVEFTINSSTDNSALDYDFRYMAGSIIVQFSDSKVTIYPRLGGGADTTASAYYPANTNTDIRVSVLPAGVFVYVNNQLKAFSRSTIFDSTFSTRWHMRSPSGTVTVSNVRIFAGKFPRYSADTRNNEIFGKLDWQLNEFGGGVNHPSSVGIAEIYLPPVREFLHRVISEKSDEGLIDYTSNALNSMLWLGRVSTRPWIVATISDSSGLYLRIETNAAGTPIVSNRTRESVQIDAAGNVFFPITHISWFNDFTRSGEWVASRTRSYINASGETLGEVYPPSVSGDIIAVTDGVTTRYRTYPISSGDFTQTFNLAVPDGATIIGASASVSVSSGTAIDISPDDKVITYTTGSGGSVKVIFDPANPPSAIGRILLIEYSYLINS